MAGRDITEGRAGRSIAVDVGIVSTNAVWQNTSTAYDCAIGGMPFIYAINDTRPYQRQTAPFRKDQFDNGSEPGEQSLTGWWIRSQSSFHRGSGIKFYDTTGGETLQYRFKDSRGVDIWTKGQVSLLNDVFTTHLTTGPRNSTTLRATQSARSIQWNTTSGVLLWDNYDVDKIAVDGTKTDYIDYNTGTAYPVYAICDDGTYAYWITNAVGAGNKLTMYKKPLTGSAASTVDEVTMFSSATITVANATMEYVKGRIVACINNAVYEISPAATALPTALYTHPVSTYVYTSVTASGPAIYVSGFNGIKSEIFKFTLTSAGAMPTLTSAVVAAEMPVGEVIHKIFYYLGYMMIGTNKGVRAANISDADGAISYGPLIVETLQPCYDFAARDRFVWCATGVNVEGTPEPGVIRIDLGQEIENLRFAWANDLSYEGVYNHNTTSCAFADGTEQLVFTTDYYTAGAENGSIYIEEPSKLVTSGFLETGAIRFSTLEPKNFKRLLARGDYSFGSMSLSTVDKDGNEYDHISYDSSVHDVEVTTSVPATAQEYVAYKFVMYRDATDNTKGPIFKGYQAKATIATKRQRLIRFPVYLLDEETDRYDQKIGYEGRANERLLALEAIEESGDIVTFQDLTTGESRQVQIEQTSLVRATPPDKKNSGQGGIVEITIRTVQQMTMAQQIIAIIVGGITIATAALVVVRWVVRVEVKDIKHETTSNGGQSMNDFIKLQIFPLLKDMRDDQLEIKGTVSALQGWKEEHTRNHA